jgi:hypothetical protein
MSREFIRENETSRAQLGQLVARLRGGDFERAVGKNWTISTLLCHLAFWDQRALFLLQEAQAGRIDPSRLSTQAIDSINQAARVLSLAIPGPAAAQLVMQSAERVDAEAAKIGNELVEQIISAGFERMLNRSLHRLEHVRKIEESLGFA